MLTRIAADLAAWTRLLALAGDAQVLAACEPKAMRDRFLHVPARLTLGARRRRMRVPETWPWAPAIVAMSADIATRRPDPVTHEEPQRLVARQRQPALRHARQCTQRAWSRTGVSWLHADMRHVRTVLAGSRRS
jgi:hypothetical protein